MYYTQKKKKIKRKIIEMKGNREKKISLKKSNKNSKEAKLPTFKPFVGLVVWSCW
jgi:hypothetical protein